MGVDKEHERKGENCACPGRLALKRPVAVFNDPCGMLAISKSDRAGLSCRSGSRALFEGKQTIWSVTCVVVFYPYAADLREK